MRLIMIGFGSVGRAFAEIVAKSSNTLRKQYGIGLKIVAIVDRGGAVISQQGVDISEALSARDSSGSVAGHSTLGHRGTTASNVIDKVEADVLLELTPTILPDGEPGLSHIESAIKKGMNVVTTNKGPLAAAMPSLLELARYQGIEFKFSGTVGGGTPILNFAKKCLTGCKIESVEGILNGTTNYILTRMLDSGITTNEALKEAQEAGFAEADPTYDMTGLDTASKLVIISNSIMDRRVSITDVDYDGISKVTVEDMEKARRSGNAIKLVGRIDDFEISVHPRTIPLTSPLCVRGSLNTVLFNTDIAGTVALTGRGAGGTETSVAVLRDLIDLKRTLMT
ncbi:MAG: homoserine dehydrogenase [Candidatus Bathyarchaeia archaeon]|jgi:homoserine dehydrogenase